MKKTKNKGGSVPPKQATHFLCFPIASDQTVPQIEKSLEHWRKITTRPARQPPIRKDKLGEEAGSETITNNTRAAPTRDDSIPNIDRPTTETLEEKLKVLHPSVTREAGTYHLTLGVMDLAEEAVKQKALEILRGLNLQDLLKAAEKGPPSGFKPARKWEEKRPADLEKKVKENAAGDESLNPTEPKIQIDSDHLPPGPLHIALMGLGGFSSLQNARVLWARPREQLGVLSDSEARPTLSHSDRLYNFGLHLIQPFRDAGIITETRPLALHATVVNTRFAKKSVQGRHWMKGNRGMKPDYVDARNIARVWNQFNGNVSAASEMHSGTSKTERSVDVRDDGTGEEEELDEQHRSQETENEFVWIKDVPINRVAICKLGASKHDDPVWGQWYPAIEDGERLVFES